MPQVTQKLASACFEKHIRNVIMSQRVGLQCGKDIATFYRAALQQIGRLRSHGQYRHVITTLSKALNLRLIGKIQGSLESYARGDHSHMTQIFTRVIPKDWLKVIGRETGDVSKRDLIEKIVGGWDKQTLNYIFRRRGGTSRAIESIVKSTGIGDPDKIARVVFDGIVSGKTKPEMAADLMPLMHGNAASANRIVRELFGHVATQQVILMSQSLKPLLIGFQVHSELLETTREAHRERHRTIYYYEPKQDQHSIDEMPQPPYEADGMLAHNCVCTLTPVIADPFKKTQITGRPIPDREEYQRWFDKAPVAMKRKLVGTKRWMAVRKTKEVPVFADFFP